MLRIKVTAALGEYSQGRRQDKFRDYLTPDLGSSWWVWMHLILHQAICLRFTSFELSSKLLCKCEDLSDNPRNPWGKTLYWRSRDADSRSQEWVVWSAWLKWWALHSKNLSQGNKTENKSGALDALLLVCTCECIGVTLTWTHMYSLHTHHTYIPKVWSLGLGSCAWEDLLLSICEALGSVSCTWKKKCIY